MEVSVYNGFSPAESESGLKIALGCRESEKLHLKVTKSVFK